MTGDTMTILMEEILLGTESFESTDVEFEYEVYLHNPDLEYIASNSPHKVLQEQYGIYVPKSDKNASTGSIRARKELFLVDNQVNYEMTIKTKLKDGSNLESNVVITQEMYDQFTLLPDEGMRKLRCIVEAGDDVQLEIDVFETLAGDPVEWVKIDIEMNDGERLTEERVKELIPFSYEDIIIVSPGGKDENPELMKKLDELYKSHFTITNKHL